jgi:membrane-bound lytic murein transglycosylase D
LRSNKAPLGRSLKIYSTEESIASSNKIQTKSDTIAVKETTALASNTNKVFKEEKVVSYKDVTKIYKVKSGDNISEIANKYDVAVADVKKWNKLRGTNINTGQKLKIIKNERVVTTVRKEVKSEKAIVDTKTQTSLALKDTNSDDSQNNKDFYEVQKGDNLLSIAKKFNVSTEDLKEWNNLDDSNVQMGSKLALANKQETAKEDEPTETKIIEYKVKKGDNLGSIAHKHNVSVAEIKEWNELEDNNVRLGATIIVSKSEIAANDTKFSNKENSASNQKDEVKLYYVKKGDSLFSIAKKYNVTASDIKKWNGIKNESLKPGMKLKISG